MSPPAPFLSVVVPVYDRERLLWRCLSSVLAQQDADFELIVVDDGSTDGSRALAQSVRDARLTVLHHADNRGVGAARNTGIGAARGQWVVLLDSDDELVPGALGRMQALARHPQQDQVHALWFRCRLDDGRISPEPMPAERDWDYAGYLRFMERTLHSCRDMIRCVRRACFAQLRYPETRMLEAAFHLDFARLFRSRLFPDVLRLYHQDASARLAPTVRALDRLDALPADPGEHEFVRDSAAGYGTLLGRHGAALRRWAPRVHRQYLRRAAVASLHAGAAAEALQYAARLLIAQPWSHSAWTVFWSAAARAMPGAARLVAA